MNEIKDVGILTIGGSVIAYFVGWAWIWGFPNYFGINILSLDISFDDILMYAFVSIRFYISLLFAYTTELFVVLTLLVIFGIFVQWGTARGTAPFVNRARTIGGWAVSKTGKHPPLVGLLAAVVFFPTSFYLSSLGGELHARNLRSHPDTFVQFLLKSDKSDEIDSDFSYYNHKRALTIILETRNSYFAYQQDIPNNGSLPVGYVFKIPREDVRVVETVMREE